MNPLSKIRPGIISAVKMKPTYLIMLFFLLLQVEISLAKAVSANSYLLPKTLSLQEAILLAIRNNPKIKNSELQRVVDRFALEVARNQFLPKYSFPVSAVYSNSNKPYYTATPSTTLETIYGTKIGLGLENQVNMGRETAAFLEVRQPLLQGAGATIGRAKRQNAYQEEIISRLRFKAILIDTINEVIMAYYKVVQDDNNYEIAQLSVKEALKTLQATKLHIMVGKMAPTEITQQQAQVANLKIMVLSEKNSLTRDYRHLLLLLGLNPNSEIRINKQILMPVSSLLNQQDAVNMVLDNNIEYQSLCARRKQLELKLVLEENEQKWQLDVIGRTQQRMIRNKNFATVPLNQIDTIGNERPSNERSLTINLSIPIKNIEHKQKLTSARVALKQFNIEIEAQRQKLITDTLNMLENMQVQLETLKLAKEAVNYSQQSFLVAQKKFMYGRISMFELTYLQRNSILQQFDLTNQQISFIYMQLEFEKLLGVSLKKWHIDIQE